MLESFIGKSMYDLDTPSLIIDIGIVKKNIKKMAGYFKDRPCQVRPHTKTHKLPYIAHLQIEAGAMGVTCARLSEAQVFMQHGIKDILLANQVVGEAKIQKLVGISQMGDITICIDSIGNARAISEIAGHAGMKINVLVEVDVGLKRCGIEPGIKVLDFTKEILLLPNLNFRGLIGYEGSVSIDDDNEKLAKVKESNNKLVDSKKLLVRDGIEVMWTSAGGSNTYEITGNNPEISDVQVGSYVTMDLYNTKYGQKYDQALYVLTTVISKSKNTAVTDAGQKSISYDLGMPQIHRRDDAEICALNEEHGRIKHNGNIKIGEKLLTVPWHGCTTVSMYDWVALINNKMVIDILPVAARGACL